MPKGHLITAESIFVTARRVIDAAIADIQRAHPDYDTRVACSAIVADGLRSRLFIETDTEDFKSRP